MGKAAPAFARDLTFSLRIVTDSVPERRCLCFECKAMAEAHKEFQMWHIFDRDLLNCTLTLVHN